MATAAAPAAVSEELSCSICLEAFDCPSTLSCGHSFCLRCLEAAWQAAGCYFCPQCRDEFQQKPRLRKNVTLANLVEELSIGGGGGGEAGDEKTTSPRLSCDSCLDGDVPAVRICVTCETSLCESHCRRHLQNAKFKGHSLVEPGVGAQVRKCPRHGKLLEFYCARDKRLVCTSCAIVGEHVGHELSSVEDAHEERKTRVARETRAVDERRKEVEGSVKQMEAARRKAQESVAGIRGRITGKFARLRKALDEDETEALRRVAVKERELLSRIDEDIARHEREIGELRATAARLRNLQNERDSLTFLQGHLEEMRRRKILKKSAPPPPTSLDATTISSLERSMRRLLPLVYGRSPTLDPSSAHDKLRISSDLRTVTLTAASQGRPNHPRRSDVYHQVLCSESFSSGQHYWEVDVGSRSGSCRIGVAYAAIKQTKNGGGDCFLGWSDGSWCLQKVDGSFSAWHGGVVTALSVPEPPRRVGVHLDWDAGLLSFYNAQSMAPLHSFRQIFVEPVHPWLYLGVCTSVTIVDLSGAS
ncbi:tripartite motif-containing protein 14-like [Lethenteron reissneri]|uniref:tripartite motif-containing protein 14-like n=1 Tax=Lethenteron reissneri TaxID=7753 RepID=UPI002AB6ABFB|nr:tripartite motif-containing protein 14-like [Lethenteron reissneri]